MTQTTAIEGETVTEQAIINLINNGQKPNPEIETVILNKKYETSVIEYAKVRIKGRWLKGEELLLTEYQKPPHLINEIKNYTVEILKLERWPQLENILHPQHINIYFHTLNYKHRIPNLENKLTNKDSIFTYALKHKIMLPQLADLTRKMHYPQLVTIAETIIEGRWPAIEKILLNSPEWSYHYALKIIKGRFPAAEPIIADSDYVAKYFKNILNKKIKFPPLGE